MYDTAYERRHLSWHIMGAVDRRYPFLASSALVPAAGAISHRSNPTTLVTIRKKTRTRTSRRGRRTGKRRGRRRRRGKRGKGRSEEEECPARPHSAS
jgi:hypothetical protein